MGPARWQLCRPGRGGAGAGAGCSLSPSRGAALLAAGLAPGVLAGLGARILTPSPQHVCKLRPQGALRPTCALLWPPRPAPAGPTPCPSPGSRRAQPGSQHHLAPVPRLLLLAPGSPRHSAALGGTQHPPCGVLPAWGGPCPVGKETGLAGLCQESARPLLYLGLPCARKRLRAGGLRGVGAVQLVEGKLWETPLIVEVRSDHSLGLCCPLEKEKPT